MNMITSILSTFKENLNPQIWQHWYNLVFHNKSEYFQVKLLFAPTKGKNYITQKPKYLILFKNNNEYLYSNSQKA